MRKLKFFVANFKIYMVGILCLIAILYDNYQS